MDVEEPPYDKDQSARAMGLVVALRFLLWGSSVAALTGFALLQAGRFPELLKMLALPMLLAIYLLGTGQVLLMLRMSDWGSRLLALAPLAVISVMLLPSVLASPPAVALVLGVGLILYLGAFVRQVRQMNHLRAGRWFSLTRKGALGLTLAAVVVPNAASLLTVVGGMVLALATVLGWQIWLAELRDSLARL